MLVLNGRYTKYPPCYNIRNSLILFNAKLDGYAEKLVLVGFWVFFSIINILKLRVCLIMSKENDQSWRQIYRRFRTLALFTCPFSK